MIALFGPRCPEADTAEKRCKQQSTKYFHDPRYCDFRHNENRNCFQSLIVSALGTAGAGDYPRLVRAKPLYAGRELVTIVTMSLAVLDLAPNLTPGEVRRVHGRRASWLAPSAAQEYHHTARDLGGREVQVGHT